MEILTFKTNISSPIGIQAIWDSLKKLGSIILTLIF